MAVVLGTWLILALSGVSFFALASAFVRSWAALVASVVYMAMPYHLLIDVWHRAALGEQAAFIFIPLCLTPERAGYAISLLSLMCMAGLMRHRISARLGTKTF